jgi:hypothetical protein
MSQHDHEFEPKVEEDAISRMAFWGTAGVAVVIIVGSVFVARGLFHHWARGRTPLYSATPVAAPAELGIVEQTPILDARRGLDEKARQRESLRRYDWADPQHRFAKLPIERAMDLVADPDFMRRAFGHDGGT